MNDQNQTTLDDVRGYLGRNFKLGWSDSVDMGFGVMYLSGYITPKGLVILQRWEKDPSWNLLASLCQENSIKATVDALVEFTGVPFDN